MLQSRILSRASLCSSLALGPLRSQLGASRKRVPCPLRSGTRLQQRPLTSNRSSRHQSSSKADVLEYVKPEALQRPDDAKSIEPKTDALLTEQTVSNREQRRADWAIMKEMAQYLWPKVRSILTLQHPLHIIDVFCRERWAQKSGSPVLWLC